VQKNGSLLGDNKFYKTEFLVGKNCISLCMLVYIVCIVCFMIGRDTTITNKSVISFHIRKPTVIN